METVHFGLKTTPTRPGEAVGADRDALEAFFLDMRHRGFHVARHGMLALGLGITDVGATVVPAVGFDEVAEGLDLPFVPNGTEGTPAALQDPATRGQARRSLIKDRAAAIHRAKTLTIDLLKRQAAQRVRGITHQLDALDAWTRP
jgi:hypothetical protein